MTFLVAQFDAGMVEDILTTANSSINWMYMRLPGITLDLVMGYYNPVG